MNKVSTTYLILILPFIFTENIPMKFCFTLLVMLVSLRLFAQSENQTGRHAYTFGEAKATVKTANHIVFFGYDVSLFKTTVKERGLSDFSLCTRIPNELVAWMNSKFPPKRINHKFKFDNMAFDPNSVQTLSKDKNCLTTESFTLSEDQIAKQVRTYNLREVDSEGVGFVIIPENLNRKAGYASAFLVFFDLDTRQILFAGHNYAKHKHGKSMRAYFGSALWRCILKFKRHEYKGS